MSNPTPEISPVHPIAPYKQPTRVVRPPEGGEMNSRSAATRFMDANTSPLFMLSPTRPTMTGTQAPLVSQQQQRGASTSMSADMSYSLGTVDSGTGALRVKPSMTVVYPPADGKKY